MWEILNKEDSKLIYKHSTTAEECNLTKIYTGQEGVFYAFDNILTMPIQRQLIFDDVQQRERLGIDKAELDKTIANIIENYKDPTLVYHEAKKVQDKLKDHWDYGKTRLMVASVVIIKEGEPIDFYNQEIANKKLKLWSLNKSLIGFFLNIANQKCQIAEQFLNKSSQNVLTERDLKEEQ